MSEYQVPPAFNTKFASRGVLNNDIEIHVYAQSLRTGKLSILFIDIEKIQCGGIRVLCLLVGVLYIQSPSIGKLVALQSNGLNTVTFGNVATLFPTRSPYPYPALALPLTVAPPLPLPYSTPTFTYLYLCPTLTPQLPYTLPCPLTCLPAFAASRALRGCGRQLEHSGLAGG